MIKARMLMMVALVSFAVACGDDEPVESVSTNNSTATNNTVRTNNAAATNNAVKEQCE